jgi:hypothetical protein
MSYEALMRWEWEGGTPASVSERDESRRPRRAENTHIRSKPTDRRQRAREAAAVLPAPSEGWHGDGSER